MTHVRFAVFVDEFLMLQQKFHSLHELSINSLKQRVSRLHAHDHEQFHHLQVLSVDGQGEGTAAEGIHAVDVDMLLPVGFL